MGPSSPNRTKGPCGDLEPLELEMGLQIPGSVIIFCLAKWEILSGSEGPSEKEVGKKRSVFVWGGGPNPPEAPLWFVSRHPRCQCSGYASVLDLESHAKVLWLR